MPIDQVVAMLLRQPVSQCFKRLAAIARARDRQRRIGWNALLVGHSRHKPGSVWILRMDRNREAEVRHYILVQMSDLLPQRTAIDRAA